MNQLREQLEIRHRRADTAAAVLAIFRTISNRRTSRLAIEGPINLAFPFDSLGRLLGSRPQIGQRIVQLSLKGFVRDTDSAVRLIDFVCSHFPNLNLFHYSYTEMCQADYLLTQMARLPYLMSVELTIREEELNAELVRRHQPFVRLRTLTQRNAQDNMAILAAFLPQLFPNLVQLCILCTDQFRDELLRRVRVLFPRLTRLITVGNQWVNGEVVEMGPETFEF